MFVKLKKLENLKNLKNNVEMKIILNRIDIYINIHYIKFLQN